MKRVAALTLAFLAAGFTAQAGAAGPEWQYTVRPGDTLIGVSQRFLARPQQWPQLQTLNRVTDPYRLMPGVPLRIPVALLRAQPAPAEVIAVSGTVTRDGSPLAIGTRLPAGARVEAGADSSATLRFADGSLVTLEPGASLALDTVSVYAGGGMVDTRLRLQSGRVNVRANPNRVRGGRLEVRTPSAVAAVRGTRFRVEADGDVTREETLESRVAVRAAKRSVTVPAGSGTLAARGRAPTPPVPLLPAADLSGLPTRFESLPLRFAWPVGEGARGWLAQVAPNADFVDILTERRSDKPALSVGDLPDGHYRLKVRALDANGLQGWPAFLDFEVDARPFPPVALTPGKRVRQARPTFEWSGVVGADAYVVQLARDADFKVEPTEARTQDAHWSPAADLVPGDWYWRLASVEAGETGPFSPPQALRYDPAPAAPEFDTRSLVIEDGRMRLTLPPPPEGMLYDAVLSAGADRADPVWQGESRDGVLDLPKPASGTWTLSLRNREIDGEPGPWAARTLEVPYPLWPVLLFLLVPAL